MKHTITIIIIFLIANSIFAQDFNCPVDRYLARDIDTENIHVSNIVYTFGGTILPNASVTVKAGRYITIETGEIPFIADSNNGSVFLAYTQSCEYEAGVLENCSTTRTITNTEYRSVEYSDLAYHPDEELLFMPLDDATNNTPNSDLFADDAFMHSIRMLDLTNLVEYAVELKNMPASFASDFEGLTYLYGNYFALVEENTRKVYFLEYEIINKELVYISSANLTADTNAYDSDPNSDPDDGIEGLSYNPYTNMLYVIFEKRPMLLFEFQINSAPDLSNLTLTKTKELDLYAKLKALNNQAKFTDAAAIFHLGNAFPQDNELSERILILSEQSKKIMEMDMDGNIYGNLMSLPAEIQPEGIVYVEDKIIIASEAEGGNNNSNNLASISEYTFDCNASPKISNLTDKANYIKVHPNPIVSSGILEYDLQNDARVDIFITDIIGKKVATLISNEQKSAGLHEVAFNAVSFPAGIYYCTIKSGSKVYTQKLIKAK